MDRSNRIPQFFLWAAVAYLPVLPSIRLLSQSSDPLVMVVNRTNTSVSAISKIDARKLLLGQTSTWPSGIKVLIVLKPERTGDRAAVLQKICGMTEGEYTRYELQVMFTGRPAAAVHEEASAAAVKNFVKANPGAIAFLHEADLDKDLKPVLTLE